MGAVACTVAFPDGSWAFGNFDITIAQQLMELDASSSKATDASGWRDEALKKMLPPSFKSELFLDLAFARPPRKPTWISSLTS